MLKAITISLLVHLIVFSLGPGSPNAFEYQSGWPVSVGAGGLSHPVTADLDRDGQQEIVIGSSSSGNNVFVYKPDGRIMEGWPQDAGYFVIASPTIGDIDVDGDLEILVASFASNKVVAYHHDGTIVNGWPFSVGQNVRSTIALGNIDKAYQGLELVVGVQDGSVYVWHYDGTVMEGWPQMAGTFVERSSPGIADLDGDGDLEIIVGSYKNDTEYGSVYVWHHDGTPMARWPKQTSAHLTASAAIADIDSDG
ncbi:MAG: VCBS repeat-containing protein, partial [Desulfobacterales bacterium]|nr:VCBS repeat-containing protein [Desulfobacterales bacterium]